MSKVLFFGSFLHYSAKVLDGLVNSSLVEVVGVVTTPPMPAGRKQELKKTHVHERAEALNLPVFAPEILNDETLQGLRQWLQAQHQDAPELIVTAGYGKLLPANWLSFPKTGALNLHFSLLPKYRGANPGEWALLFGEKMSGVTVIEMSPEFDTGALIAQSSVTLSPQETRETLYETLYEVGGKILPTTIKAYVDFKHSGVIPEANSALMYFLPPQPQGSSPTPYAKRLTKEDGFIAWPAFVAAMAGQPVDQKHFSPGLQEVCSGAKIKPDAAFIERAIRALAGFPGVWTIVPTTQGEKRMKILAAHLMGQKLELELVHIEGKTPTRWGDIKNTLVA